MSLDPIALADLVSRGGVVVALVFALLGGARRIWVWGYQLEEMRVDRDRWRDLALRSMGQAARTMDVAQKGVELVERRLE